MLDKTTEAYNKIAEEYNKRNFIHFFNKEYDFFKSIIFGKKVIDLGCGTGRDAEFFVNDGFDYLGVDSSEKMLKIAKEKVKNGYFLTMDLRNIDFSPKSFNGFWASASLLHFSKKEVPVILKSFYNLLNNDGVGFVSVKEKREIDEGIIKEDKYGGIERFFSFYTKEELTDFLKKTGFTIIKYSYLLEEAPSNTKWLCFFVKKC